MNDTTVTGFFKTAELASLHEKWRVRAAKLVVLNNDLDETNKKDKRSFSFMYKLEKIMDQISFFKKKELDVIREIEAVEQRHHFMREHNMLRKAGDEPHATNKIEDEEDYDEEDKPRSALSTLLLLWFLAKILRFRAPRKTEKRTISTNPN